MTSILTAPYVDTSDAPIVRTLLYNLIIVSTTSTKQAYYVELANQVAAEIPGRIIILTLDSNEASPGSRVFCSIATDGKRTFCGEVITIIMDSDPTGLPGKVFPLLAPDLPVYSLSEDNVKLDWLDNIADIDIIDDCVGKNNIASTKNTVDMTWLRLGAWMKAIIRTFDNVNAPDMIADLEDILISTEKNVSDDRIANPMLLAAWIADCLDPNAGLIEQSENARLLLNIDSRQIPLKIEHQKLSSSISCVRSVAFRFSGQRGISEILIEQESDKLCITSTPMDFMQSLSPEPVIPDGLMLAREIGNESMLHRYSAITRFAVQIGLK